MIEEFLKRKKFVRNLSCVSREQTTSSKPIKRKSTTDLYNNMKKIMLEEDHVIHFTNSI